MLGRYTAKVSSSAAKDTYTLNLSLVNVGEEDGNELPVEQLVPAKVAVGESCSASAQTPSPVDILTPTPGGGQTPPPGHTPGAGETPGAGGTPSASPTAGGTPGATATGTPDGTPGSVRTPGPAGGETGGEDDGFPWLPVIIGVVLGLGAVSAAGAFWWYRLRPR